MPIPNELKNVALLFSEFMLGTFLMAGVSKAGGLLDPGRTVGFVLPLTVNPGLLDGALDALCPAERSTRSPEAKSSTPTRPRETETLAFLPLIAT
ncbi:MAG: hypothetical protein ABJY83_04820 [Roseibium sp.]